MASKGWDGDPWEIDSDDDEFVATSSRSATNTKSSSYNTSAVGLGGGAAAAGDGSKSSGSGAGGLASMLWGGASFKQQPHAPPARPHPITIGSYKEKREAAEAAAAANTVNSSIKRISPTDRGSTTRTSWLIIDPPAGAGTSTTSLQSTLSSSSAPGASSRNGIAQTASLDRSTPPPARSDTASSQNRSAGASGGPTSKGKDRLLDPAIMKASIDTRWDEVMQDPTNALARISLRWANDNGQVDGSDTAPTSPLSPTSPLPPAITPPAPREGGPHILRATLASLPPSMDLQQASSDSGAGGSGAPSRTATPLGDAEEGAAAALQRKKSSRSSRRQQQFLKCLSGSTVDLNGLRSLAWAGVPPELRPLVWQLLLGHLPLAKEVRKETLRRKREEYRQGVEMAFAKGVEGLDQSIWHQISIDVPRTNPGRSLWQRAATQRALERILYMWAIRHPACGYVQGINDLATPFFEVFLSAYIDSSPSTFDPALLPPDTLAALEADTFWCLSKMLDGIQDNYISAQPGIHRQVRRLGELVARIDAPLHAHLQEQNVEYMQFAFRWMNCLLMREMAVQSIVRLWDTYLAEGPDAFSDFHLYVCAVFLHKWTAELQTMDFQGIIMHLQSLPTQDWSDKDAEMLLSEAFMYKTLFGNSAHLNR